MTVKNYEKITLHNIEKYRTFNTVPEMDETIYEYIEILRQDEQPESVIEVLRFLGRSSLRVTGVSFAKYQTIADKIGKSVSTVKRAVKALKDYGIIEAIPTVRKWKRLGKSRQKSVNIIVIQSSIPSMIPQDETTGNDVQTATEQADKSESQSEPVNYKHKPVKELNTYYSANSDNSGQIVIRSPYRRFKDTVGQFVGYNKQSVISKLYGVFRGQTKGLRGNYEDDELIDVAVQAINTTFMATKRKNIHNIAGFFNGVLSNLLDRMCNELMAEMFADTLA